MFIRRKKYLKMKALIEKYDRALAASQEVIDERTAYLVRYKQEVRNFLDRDFSFRSSMQALESKLRNNGVI